MYLGGHIRTVEFAYILIFASVHVLRASVYIGTTNKLLLNYGESDKHYLYTKIFSLVLPLGVVSVPAIEFFVECPRGLTLSLVLTNAMGFLYNLLALIPVLALQSAAFIVFTGFRAFLYAVVAAFTTKTFGLKNMGMLRGIIFSVGSLVSLLEYPAVYLSNLQADGDLAVVYWLSLATCMLLFPLTGYLCRRDTRRDRQHQCLMSKFNALSPDPVPHAGGLSYRRSPSLSVPGAPSLADTVSW